MATGAFLIARMSSTRLPGKNMLEILGRPMIELMSERVRASSLIDKVVICTSTDSSDAALEDLASSSDLLCYRGSLDNVMERISAAAAAHDCETIVELLGDNPLVHAELIDDLIRFYRKGGYDYAATLTKEYPLHCAGKSLFSIGVRVQVYSRKAAERWAEYADYMRRRDKHPSAYIFEHPDVFKVGYLEAAGKWQFMNKPDLTFAVNYKKNFELIRTLFKRNYPDDKNFSLKKIYEQLETEPELYRLMGDE